MKVINPTKKEKFEEFKGKVKNKLRAGKEWAMANKGIIITLAPVVIGGITTIVKVVGKNVNLRKQESVKNLYCYDRSLGHYWSLRRELTNEEWVTIDRRKKNGERLADILDELKVLK